MFDCFNQDAIMIKETKMQCSNVCLIHWNKNPEPILNNFLFFSFTIITTSSFQTRNLEVRLLKQPLLHALSLCEPSPDHADPSWDQAKITVTMHSGSDKASECYNFSCRRDGQTLQNSLQDYQQSQGQARVAIFCLLVTQQ